MHTPEINNDMTKDELIAHCSDWLKKYKHSSSEELTGDYIEATITTDLLTYPIEMQKWVNEENEPLLAMILSLSWMVDNNHTNLDAWKLLIDLTDATVKAHESEVDETTKELFQTAKQVVSIQDKLLLALDFLEVLEHSGNNKDVNDAVSRIIFTTMNYIPTIDMIDWNEISSIPSAEHRSAKYTGLGADRTADINQPDIDKINALKARFKSLIKSLKITDKYIIYTEPGSNKEYRYQI